VLGFLVSPQPYELRTNKGIRKKLMAQSKQQKYWLIRGWDGFNLIFEEKINVGQITERQLKELLKALTGKVALSENELVSSYAKKGTRTYQNFLEVQFMEGNKYMYSCGDNPYVTAEIEIEHAATR
jgi:hypothetical protein